VSGMRICVICRNVPDLWLFRKAEIALQKPLPLLCPSCPGMRTKYFRWPTQRLPVAGIERQLFLLSKDRASRIDGIELHGAEPQSIRCPMAPPYLVSSNGGNSSAVLYYLIGDKATPVQEGHRTRGCLTEIRVLGGIALGAKRQAVLARTATRTEAETASQPDDAP